MEFSADFIKRIENDFPNDYGKLLSSLNNDPVISIRHNPKKVGHLTLDDKIPWTVHGEYLDERPAYAQDPSFHAGAYYPQEASSMALEPVLRFIDEQIPINRILDLCASPGGKSTHILSLIPSEAVLLSNEIVPKRFTVLNENLIKWGYPNFMTSNYHPKQIARLEDVFDVVVVDAPCSGEGLFRKQPKWRSQWTESNCELCANRQKDILAQADKLLRPGGYLIYSTCTLNPSENVETIAHANEQFNWNSISIPELLKYNFQEVHQKEAVGYMALPHLVRGEPFFISCLKKAGDAQPLMARTSRILYEDGGLDASITRSKTLFQKKNEDYYDLNAAQVELAEHAEFAKLRLQLPSLGSFKGKSFIPTHFAAMHINSPLQAHHIDTNKENALAYLRHENLQMDGFEKGWYMLVYKQVNLGWVKYDGRRWINKYPMKWRLRK